MPEDWQVAPTNERTEHPGETSTETGTSTCTVAIFTPPVNTESNRLFQNLGGVDLDVSFLLTLRKPRVWAMLLNRPFRVRGLTSTTTAGLTFTSSTIARSFQMLSTSTSKTEPFEDISVEIGLDLGIYSMSSSFADYDKDLDWDVFISNGQFPKPAYELHERFGGN